MEPIRQSHSLLLSAHQLPGADTNVKLAALQSRNPRYQLLLQEVARLGWPVCFCDDLYLHDREKLEASGDERMIWILRQSRTHLYPAKCGSTGERDYYRRVIHYWSGEDKLNVAMNDEDRAKFYLLTQDTLTPITWQAAGDALRVDEDRPGSPST